MQVNLYQKLKFFPHDFTLIASVVGESDIHHGIGGKDNPIKMARLAKCHRWSKQWLSVITWSHNHSMSDGSKIQVCVNVTCFMESLHRIIHHLTDWSIKDTPWESEWTYENLDRNSKISNPQMPCVSRLSYWHSHTTLMDVPHQLIGIGLIWDPVETYTMRTCLTSIFWDRITSNNHHNFLIKSLSPQLTITSSFLQETRKLVSQATSSLGHSGESTLPTAFLSLQTFFAKPVLLFVVLFRIFISTRTKNSLFWFFPTINHHGLRCAACVIHE